MSTVPRSHEAIEPLIAADALGGLEDAGRDELQRLRTEHGADCAECLRLGVEYLEVAGLLATSLEPMAVSPAAEERLMAAVAAEPQTAEPQTAAPERAGRKAWPSTVRQGTPAAGRRPRKLREAPSRARRWIAAAAVAAAVAVVAGVVGYTLAPSRTQPGTQVIAFPATDGQQIQVTYEPGATSGLLVATGLPTPTDGQVYELWYILPDNPNPQAAGTFVPTNGSVVATVKVDPSFAALAVSVEPAGGSSTAQGPRGPVILQAAKA
jgi:anti-sigma-K factor RskA